MKKVAQFRHLLTVGALLSARVMACPGCKDSRDPSGSFWMNGYNWSIVFMLAVIGTLVGAVAFNVYKIAQREAAASSGDAMNQYAARGYWSVVTLPACGAIIAVLMVLGSLEAAPAQKFASEQTVRAALAAPQGMVLVMFKSPSCSVCEEMSPAIAKLETEFAAKVKLVYCNSRENKTLAREFNVDNLPCLILVNGGREIDRREGFRTEADLRRWISNTAK